MLTEDFELTTDSFKKALSQKSIICYKNNVNFNIAKTKFNNLKKLRTKFLLINSIRIIVGILENIYNKTAGCKEYETIYIGEESQQKV